ncbi:LysR family transcriptional regulator [Pseudomonas sp. NPDC089752]|uniref:LysR family transcriptional regulator n=1 Tax=Pseudomonas sp. NPDC089752 TaxID=3364472 RepID=UPI003829B3CC
MDKLAALSKLDLNLVIAFLAIHREENLTRAAKVLGVGQPAMSATLNRLRGLFDEPLFIRINKGMRPTEGGDKLAATLAPMVESLTDALLQQITRKAHTVDHSSDHSFTKQS